MMDNKRNVAQEAYEWINEPRGMMTKSEKYSTCSFQRSGLFCDIKLD